MAAYYADSSALMKRHVVEVGSAWFSTLASPAAGNIILTAQLSLVEVFSALNRRVRESSISLSDYQQIRLDLDHIWSTEYEIIRLARTIVDEARLLLERHPLRAYDAVQLASAIQGRRDLLVSGFAAPIFLSADDRLLKAAQAEGFATDNPNAHP
jgi:hypothetical protein